MQTRFMVFIITFAITGAASATPPARPAQIFNQSNGDQIHLQRMKADGLQWFVTHRGEVVVFNKQSGNYEYARVLEDGDQFKLLPSGVKVGEKTKSTEFSITTQRELLKLRNKKSR
ncbi:hypothetical protein TERTU_2097 [Teredinibacter turnerae T7901]|uniref:Uncharacterized protein n=1 Tax=Teredinibacter turnerae (strain ATCC 39867 / T7901) TaxID=377629 RepID=C5BJ93_TERTT|nr:hypothetical protein [Teredinibacter turnerae]ACR11175.1 hypothetical protein TERTU_2097 [Teredinibacter turnerae T7901]